ncbi:hypothetical protein L2E82_19076 [Cichorium intybus]|uniref:Uncharacterized protein n=1 Tax=Cichorium intybus TaxID=13427 RepID=A0ACB9FAM9_CICIN|nr:hypothetical protein L2E82_19076 [Cichorium intybus]
MIPIPCFNPSKLAEIASPSLLPLLHKWLVKERYLGVTVRDQNEEVMRCEKCRKKDEVNGQEVPVVPREFQMIVEEAREKTDVISDKIVLNKIPVLEAAIADSKYVRDTERLEGGQPRIYGIIFLINLELMTTNEVIVHINRLAMNYANMNCKNMNIMVQKSEVKWMKIQRSRFCNLGSVPISNCRMAELRKKLEVFVLGIHKTECVIVWSPYLVCKEESEGDGGTQSNPSERLEIDVGQKGKLSPYLLDLSRTLIDEFQSIPRVEIEVDEELHKNREFWTAVQRSRRDHKGLATRGRDRSKPNYIGFLKFEFDARIVRMGQMVVVHAKARNNRNLNAASVQVETVLEDEFDSLKMH